ncbi:MAG: hypothetical protein LBL86_07125 [Coriobacteriales bacterium]|jgi:hypothetical protein|nr:hypothetical protein [Coriobacteriales bacterium]
MAGKRAGLAFEEMNCMTLGTLAAVLGCGPAAGAARSATQDDMDRIA